MRWSTLAAGRGVAKYGVAMLLSAPGDISVLDASGDSGVSTTAYGSYGRLTAGCDDGDGRGTAVLAVAGGRPGGGVGERAAATSGTGDARLDVGGGRLDGGRGVARWGGSPGGGEGNDDDVAADGSRGGVGGGVGACNDADGEDVRDGGPCGGRGTCAGGRGGNGAALDTCSLTSGNADAGVAGRGFGGGVGGGVGDRCEDGCCCAATGRGGCGDVTIAGGDAKCDGGNAAGGRGAGGRGAAGAGAGLGTSASLSCCSC